MSIGQLLFKSHLVIVLPLLDALFSKTTPSRPHHFCTVHPTPEHSHVGRQPIAVLCTYAFV